MSKYLEHIKTGIVSKYNTKINNLISDTKEKYKYNVEVYRPDIQQKENVKVQNEAFNAANKIKMQFINECEQYIENITEEGTKKLTNEQLMIKTLQGLEIMKYLTTVNPNCTDKELLEIFNSNIDSMEQSDILFKTIKHMAINRPNSTGIVELKQKIKEHSYGVEEYKNECTQYLAYYKLNTSIMPNTNGMDIQFNDELIYKNASEYFFNANTSENNFFK